MDREAFRSEVATLMTGTLGQVERFLAPFGSDQTDHLNRLKQQLHSAADMYATLLQEPDQAEQAAHNLMSALFGAHGANDPTTDWWRTEAGQAVAYAIGYHRSHAYRADAVAILGISRQRVHELIGQGVLVEEGPRGVTAESIRARLRSQRPM
jgi:cell division septum initiation protein DivIVA